MEAARVLLLLGATRLFPFTAAQQFTDTLLGLDYPGLSENCLEALNSTVTACPSFLIQVSVNNPRLNSEELQALCNNGCLESLRSVRQIIQNGCNTNKDVVQFDGVVFPATYVVDRFIYTHQLSCRKESGSGKYCDEVFRSWIGSNVKASECSDCMLGAMQVQLNSPFGYHDEFAQDFASATSSCGANGYAFTSPAPYAISANPAPDPTPPTCSDPYVVKAGDSCDAIALSKGISSYAIITAGNLLSDCTNLQVGAELCLPGPCELYRVQIDDTCESIVKRYTNLDVFGLLSWNPNINPLCRNLKSLVSSLVCVSPPGSSGRPVPTPAPTPTDEVVTPVPKPTNGKDESNYPCAKWHTVQDGDHCESISIRQGIQLKDLYYLNPSLNTECTNLLLDIAYCVSAVGDINTYPGYPYSTTALYTLTSATYTTTTQTFSAVKPSITPLTELPLAPGSLSECESYVDYFPVEAIADQREQPYLPIVGESINSCDFATTANEVSLEDFLSWNPSLVGKDPCLLQAGYRYCSLKSSDYILEYEPDSHCLTGIGEPYPGTIATCTCFTTLVAEEHGLVACIDIAEDFSISIEQLRSWNPWVGSDCDNDAFTGIGEGEARPICVGVDKDGSSSSATSSPTKTTGTSTPTGTSSSTLPTTTPPAPTQPGIIAGCTKYYVAVDGDGCWAIADKNSIPLDSFYEWNPAVGNDCGGLWLGYAYCVGI